MMICPVFDDDEDTNLMNMQHDVYGHALNILIANCNHLVRFAIVVLDDKEHDVWRQIRRYDHRTLQAPHDLLAAAWRFNNDSQQGILPYSSTANDASAESLWLDWLWKETTTSIDHPQLVRSVQLILTNQNTPIGYAAETNLCLGIIDRFGSVPWKRCIAPGSLDTSLSHAAGLSDIAVCHA